jgi:hypothetical protein
VGEAHGGLINFVNLVEMAGSTDLWRFMDD